MPSNPWRYRCPEGHSSIDLWVSRFYCHSCGTSYPRDDLQDLKS
jgi:transposase-like protein